ncbi:MAG TPA: hypothetical protein VI136_13515 [Verrucomicrobiae bacterium]
MQTTETSDGLRFAGKVVGLFGAGIFLLPFVYLTSLALLLSAYVHGCAWPTRPFLKAYAAPSNQLVHAPWLGRVYGDYFEFWVRITGADQPSGPNQP